MSFPVGSLFTFVEGGSKYKYRLHMTAYRGQKTRGIIVKIDSHNKQLHLYILDGPKHGMMMRTRDKATGIFKTQLPDGNWFANGRLWSRFKIHFPTDIFERYGINVRR